MRRFQSFGTIFHVRGGPRAPPALFALGTWTLFLVHLNLAVFGFLQRSLVFSTSQTSIARVYGRELFRIWKQPDTLTSRSSMVSFCCRVVICSFVCTVQALDSRQKRRGICAVESVAAHLRGFEEDSSSEVVFWIDELSIEFRCYCFIVEEHVQWSAL